MIGSLHGATKSGLGAAGLLRNRFTPIQYRFFTLFWDPYDVQLGLSTAARLAVFIADSVGQVAQVDNQADALSTAKKMRNAAGGPASTDPENKRGYELVKLRFLDPEETVLAENPYVTREAMSQTKVAPLAPGERERSEKTEVKFAGLRNEALSGLDKDYRLVLRWVVGLNEGASSGRGTAPKAPGSSASQAEKDAYAAAKADWDAADLALSTVKLTYEDNKLRVDRNVGGSSKFAMSQAVIEGAQVQITLGRSGIPDRLIEMLSSNSPMATLADLRDGRAAKAKVDAVAASPGPPVVEAVEAAPAETEIVADVPMYHWLSSLDGATDGSQVVVKAQSLRVFPEAGRAVYSQEVLYRAVEDWAVGEMDAFTKEQRVETINYGPVKAIIKSLSVKVGGVARTIADSDWVTWSGGKLRVRTKPDRTFTEREIRAAARATTPSPPGAGDLMSEAQALDDQAYSGVAAGNLKTLLAELPGGVAVQDSDEFKWHATGDNSPKLVRTSVDATTVEWSESEVQAQIAVVLRVPAMQRLHTAIAELNDQQFGLITDGPTRSLLESFGEAEEDDRFSAVLTGTAPDQVLDGLTRVRTLPGGIEEAETWDAAEVDGAAVSVIYGQSVIDWFKTVTDPTYVDDLQDSFANQLMFNLVPAGEADAIAAFDLVTWTSSGLLVQQKQKSTIGEDKIRDAALVTQYEFTEKDWKDAAGATQTGAGATTKTIALSAIDGIYKSLATFGTVWRGAFSSADDEYLTWNVLSPLVGEGSLVAMWEGVRPTASDKTGRLVVSSPAKVYKEADWSTTTVNVEARFVPNLKGELEKTATPADSVAKDIIGITGGVQRVSQLDKGLRDIVVQLRDPDAPGVPLLGSDNVEIKDIEGTDHLVKDVATSSTYHDLPETVTIERAITEKVTVEPRYMSDDQKKLFTDSATTSRARFDELMRGFAEFTSVEYGGYDIAAYSFKPINVPVPKRVFESRTPKELVFKTGHMSQSFLYNWCADADYGAGAKKSGLAAASAALKGKPSIRKDGLIFMLDRAGVPLRLIKFAGALPVSWSGAALDAGGGDQPLDELKVICDRLRVTHMGIPGVM